ncbi:Linearmycin resistance ATP-binding protein LnrL [Mycovorax composti]|jgi:ABC-type multidrug transport system, ATPase component|uniref:Linearmycin resistance ATP-binding protein LnrL n=2 Tax=Chitinophagaceae TaxID=563835 RepID=A0ABZ2EHK6_9BACT
MSAIQIEQLSFRYKGQQSLIKNLSLTVNVGERFGIFGPNGAGKTTLMNLITGLLPYEQGSIKILDKEVRSFKDEIKQLIGLVPQDFSFYEQLSPIENMQFFGAWYGMSKMAIKNKTEELLQVMGLDTVAHKPVKLFSGGMKRRVNLAIGVMNNPQILFLDEPTVGVDVQSRNAIIEFLKKLNASGTTLVYTSHQLGEAEDLCNVVSLYDEGEIIAHGALDVLLSTHRHTGLEGLFLELTGRNYRD